MKMGYLLFGKDGYFTYVETYKEGRMIGRDRQNIPNSVIEDAVFNYVRNQQSQNTPVRELATV